MNTHVLPKLNDLKLPSAVISSIEKVNATLAAGDDCDK
jgi:hypothetical protein